MIPAFVHWISLVRRALVKCTKHRILIVDDQLVNLKLLKIHLTSAGYQIEEATNGQAALSKAGEANPDLILLDIMMPGMDGFETCRRLKKNEKIRETPVIFLSAIQDSKTKVDCFKLGGVDYISKPFTPAEG